jgi:hypothetical protein
MEALMHTVTHVQKRLKKPQLSKLGFTIAEVMIAMLIMGGLMMAMTELMIVNMRNNRSLVLDSEFNSLVNSVSLILGRPEICSTSTLLGTSFAGSLPIMISEINVPGDNFIKVGPLVPGLRLLSIKIDKIFTSAITGPNDVEWLVNLKVHAKKTDPVMVGRVELIRDFKVSLTIDKTTNLIKKCGGASLGPSLADNCAANGGAFDAGLMTCDLAKPVCERSGGIYDPALKKCDKTALHYVVTQTGVRSIANNINVMCTSGDIATGGSAESHIPTDIARAYPLLSGGRAVGWNCSGVGIKFCNVICEKLM